MTNNLSSILSELECPSCKDYMIEEIVVCEEGHSTCWKCKKEGLNNGMCVICQKTFAVERNHTLEKVVATFKFPCKNQGCGKMLDAKNIYSHERSCEFGVYECVLYFTGCPWSGKLSELSKHIKSKHKEHTKGFVSVNNVKTMVNFFKDDVFVIFNKHTDYSVTFAATYNGTKKTPKDFKLRVAYVDQSEKGYELVATMPCIARCKLEEVFESDKFVLSKINSTLQERFLKNGKYSIDTTIFES